MKPERKMQVKDFVKLNKVYGDFNEGKELPEDFLKNIYTSIASEQILTSDSDANNNSNILRSEQWTDLIRLSFIRENQFLICHKREDFIDDADHKEFQSMHVLSSSLRFTRYDRDIFSIIYKYVLESSTSLLESSEDRYNLEYSRDGYITCAHIASHYNMNVIVDEIIESLARTSHLTTEYIDSNNINNPIEFVYSFSIKPSCQLSIVTLFGIVRKLPNDIQKSWTTVLKCIIHLYFMGILPASLYKESENDFITKDERFKYFNTVVTNIYNQCAKINQSNALYISKLLPWANKPMQEDYTIQQYPICPSLWLSILQGNDFDEALNVPDINNKSLKVISCLNCRYPPASPDQKSVPNDVYSYMEMKRNTAKEEPSSPVPSHTDDILIDNTGHHSFLTEIAFECISKCRLETFIENSTNWSGVTLDLFTDGILALCTTPYQMEERPPEEPQNPTRIVASEISRAFCIQLLTEVLLKNKERYTLVWDKILTYISDMLKTTESYTFIVEKIVLMLYRLCIHVIQDDMGEDLLLSLSSLISMKRDVFISIAPQIASATYQLFVAKGVFISSQGHWGDLQKILDSCANIPNTVNYNYQTLQFIFTDPHIQQCIPISFASTLNVFLQTSITSANMVMDILDYSLILHSNVMLLLSNEDPNITWNNSWSPVLRTVTIACMDKRQQVREKALKVLSSMLLDKHTNVLTNNEWCNVILHVLYPILKDVLMDIVGVKDNSNAVLRNRVNRMAENSVISLLLVVMVNVFTYRMESIVTNEEFGRIWVQTLLIFQFVESISIKNSSLMKENEKLLCLLLIRMEDLGLFHLGDQKFASETWKVTEDILEKISPSIKKTFFSKVAEDEEAGSQVVVHEVNNQEEQKTEQEPTETSEVPPASSE